MSEGTQTTQTTQATEPQGGGNSPAWFEREDIDQSLVSDKVKSFGDINGLLKSYSEAQSYIGGAVKIPGENATDEERGAFYAKLGRPESPDKYTWTPPEGISVEGATADNFKAFKELCFKNGMTDRQVSAVMGGWSDIVSDITSKRDELLAKVAAESKAVLSAPNEWGDKYQERYNAAQKKIDDLGIRAHVEAAGIANDANFLKAIDSIISGAKESRIRGTGGKFVSPGERMEQLKLHPAYMNAGHPEHKAVIDELNSLYAKMGA